MAQWVLVTSPDELSSNLGLRWWKKRNYCHELFSDSHTYPVAFIYAHKYMDIYTHMHTHIHTHIQWE